MLTEAVQSLILQFVRRQVLVLTVLRQVCPDIVMRSRGEGTPEELAALTQRAFRRRSLGMIGMWGGWNYRIHGSGCCCTSSNKP